METKYYFNFNNQNYDYFDKDDVVNQNKSLGRNLSFDEETSHHKNDQ